ncbi:septation protein SepH [Corynebacterium appendicis]|uniref:septation protein SepH n=1 Tax=Corynebacterium appendicis TaxID=163202 RepID=UPI00254E405B|nr:septation protein SepH [Corynebacterium appendicis]MDK8625748.1 septation protein SepH [Corynebacterium appendicis]
MRELFVVAEESTDTVWVLRTEDGERFRIPRADLREVGEPDPVLFNAERDYSETSAEADFTDAFDNSGDEYELVDAELVDEPSRPTFTVYSGDEPDDPEESEETPPAPEPAEEPVVEEPAQEPADEPAHEPEEELVRSPVEPDPLFATPLSLRPNEIQARIRAGADATALAEEMGVAESRIEPYAHPVLLERAQVAEAAKQSHPIRDDGTAPDTLFEVLALAFATRGHALSEAHWDAVREAGEPWVVRVTWQAGLQEHSAEWFFRRSMGSPATTEPRDPVAADLIDPSFAQPVRSLRAHNSYAPEPDYAEEESYPQDDIPAGEDNLSVTQTQPNDFAEGDFLQNPEPEEKPQKRRRKAVTPHWEDVLLGVRTNTKRPK